MLELLSRFEHLHMCITNLELARPVVFLGQLRLLVEASQSIKTLVLAHQLSPTVALAATVGQARDALLRTCAAKGVTVLWRLNSKAREDDFGISKEFWDYAKELKRKKQLEAAEEGSSGGSE
jgi:hypothetical protein